MPTPLRAERVANGAMLLAAALILSYIESLIPTGALIPIPGIKLGLANIVMMLALYRSGATDAAFIGSGRVLLSALLFGNLPSLWFSASGFICAFTVAAVCRYVFPRRVSLIGASVASAAAHVTGQIAAASLMLGVGVFGYLPVLLISSAVTGTVTGVVALLLGDKLGAIRLRK